MLDAQQPFNLTSSRGNHLTEDSSVDIRLAIFFPRKIRRQTPPNQKHMYRRGDMLGEVVPVLDGLFVVIVIQTVVGALELDQQILTIEILVQQQIRTFVGIFPLVRRVEYILNLPLQRDVGAEE